MAPVGATKILAVLRASNLRCDTVDSYTPVGKNVDGSLDGYMVRCHDGGRYIYFQNAGLGRMGAVSCQAESFHYGYRCPD